MINQMLNHTNLDKTMQNDSILKIFYDIIALEK